MPRIKIEDIRIAAEEQGWSLVSEEYENLDSELVFECTEGHKVYLPWKQVRDKWVCPVCKANIYKDQTTKILPKKKGSTRILALDQATHISGYSIFEDEVLIKYGIFKTTLDEEIERDNALKIWLVNMIQSWQIDYLALEDIQLQQINGKQIYGADNVVGIQTFKILAHLQGILMEAAFELNIPFILCSPSTWRAHCGVKGKNKADRKKSMQLLAKQWYDVRITNDEADSIGIGKYASEVVFKKPRIVSWE